MRLIDADNLLDRMEKACNECKDKGALCGACYFETVKDMVENEETAHPRAIKTIERQKLNHKWIIGKSV